MMRIGKYRLVPVCSVWDSLNNTATFKIDDGGFTCPECNGGAFRLLAKTDCFDVKCSTCGEPIMLNQ